MKRMDFIKTISLAAAGSPLLGWTDQDFHAVRKDSKAGSLEPILLDGKETIPAASEVGSNIPFAARHPSLIYLFNAEPESGCKYSPFSVGLGTILNKEGFVLTSYHVMQEMVEDGKVALLYDPSTSVIRKIDMLSYSTKDRFDLALCRAELPEAYRNLAPLSITRGSMTKGNIVYMLAPDQNVLTSRDLVAEVLHSVKIYGCSAGKYSVEQIDVPAEREWNWAPVVCSASYIERPGDHDPFFAAPTELGSGYSGIAALSAVHNDITGILIKQGGLFTGPESIRRFIADYIYKSTGKWVPLEAEASGRTE